ncbi:MAG TPA: DUF4129 domain-containing protein [Puia sp.]|jgi:hypothetical protein|nr:DUF4129 domain-containing protein [Puia sp.]
MTGKYRAGIVGVLLGLFACIAAFAQTGDTVRQDSPQSSVSDTSVYNGKDAVAEHAGPVVLRAIGDSVVRDWKRDGAYAYANDPDYWHWREPRRVSTSSGGWLARFLSSRGFEYFILFLMGGILLYAIVRIIVANRLQLFYRAPRRSNVVKTGDEDGAMEDDLEGRLTHFMQIRDYRQAVRYLYLKTLRVLNDRGMIRYHQESTNHEYWQQLRATPQGGPFRDLTMIYEKVWYGEFPLGDMLFTRLHRYFEDFYKSVRA